MSVVDFLIVLVLAAVGGFLRGQPAFKARTDPFSRFLCSKWYYVALAALLAFFIFVH